jgi:hypothetical protein
LWISNCFVLFRLVYPKLSASLYCHFWMALWYSLTFSYRRLTFFPNCIWTPTFSAKHNILATVVWHTSLMLFLFNTVTTNFNGEGEMYRYRFLRIVVCPFFPLLSFFGPLYYRSFFDLRIAITFDIFLLLHMYDLLYLLNISMLCLSNTIGMLIPSTTKYINMCSILFIVPFYLII